MKKPPVALATQFLVVALLALAGRGVGAQGGAYTFTSLNVPTSYTVALGINDAGQIVGRYNDSPYHGFLLNGSTLTTIDVPGSGQTMAFGINNAGQIVGGFRDTNGIHGFLATPTPEPGTLILLATGLVGLLVYGWRQRKKTVSV